MIVAENIREEETFPTVVCVKKTRTESTSSVDSTIGTDQQTSVRNLELEGVKEIFQDYDLLETAEAVACVVCGKNYKSKVCVKKHLWEHSVYWDLFDGLKKQQRVLSIQAAIILAIKFNPSLSRLLVTQPSNSGHKRKSEKTHEKPHNIKITESNHHHHPHHPLHVHTDIKTTTSRQEKQTINLTDNNNNTINNNYNMYNLESPTKKRKFDDLELNTSPIRERNSIDFLTNLSVTRSEALGR